MTTTAVIILFNVYNTVHCFHKSYNVPGIFYDRLRSFSVDICRRNVVVALSRCAMLEATFIILSELFIHKL